MSAGLSYAVDVVVCIDATASMVPFADSIEFMALTWPEAVRARMAEVDKRVDQLRVRVIAFRDTVADAESLVASDFFTLPDDREAFLDFVARITFDGGGDEPESGLEALAVAINSAWTADGDRRRHVIVIMTDASAHPLEKGVGKVPSAFASQIPSSFDELSDMWTGGQATLVLFTPDMSPWSTIIQHWGNVVMFPSQGGVVPSPVEYDEIIDILVTGV